MQKIKREDTVLVVRGKDRGRTGPVRKVMPKDNLVIVTGVNLVKRHMARAAHSNRVASSSASPAAWANVVLLCASCNKPARVGFRERADGAKVRFCKRCDENMG